MKYFQCLPYQELFLKQKHHWFRLLFFFLSCFVCLHANTLFAETSIDIYGISYHSGDGKYENKDTGEIKKYNSFNYGVGLSQQIIGPLHGIVGMYENSYKKTSRYAGLELFGRLPIDEKGDFSLIYGTRMFYASGYKNTHLEADKYMGIAVLQIGAEYNDVRVSVASTGGISILYLSYIFKR